MLLAYTQLDRNEQAGEPSQLEASGCDKLAHIREAQIEMQTLRALRKESVGRTRGNFTHIQDFRDY